MKALYFLIVLLASYRNSVEERELYGRYVYNASVRAGDTIELKPDKIYRFCFIENEKKMEISGKWELKYSGRVVEFQNYHIPTELPPGTWSSRIRIEGDEIQLMYADDINQYYRKID